MLAWNISGVEGSTTEATLAKTKVDQQQDRVSWVGLRRICGGCHAGYVVDVAQDMWVGWWSNPLCGLLPTRVEVELG